MSDQQNRIIRLATVLDRTDLSRYFFYRKMSGGRFASNGAISTRCTGLRGSAVDTWTRNPMFFSVEDFSTHDPPYE
jgi:prophage regulatory protein